VKGSLEEREGRPGNSSAVRKKELDGSFTHRKKRGEGDGVKEKIHQKPGIREVQIPIPHYRP